MVLEAEFFSLERMQRFPIIWAYNYPITPLLLPSKAYPIEGFATLYEITGLPEGIYFDYIYRTLRGAPVETGEGEARIVERFFDHSPMAEYGFNWQVYLSFMAPSKGWKFGR